MFGFGQNDLYIEKGNALFVQRYSKFFFLLGMEILNGGSIMFHASKHRVQLSCIVLLLLEVKTYMVKFNTVGAFLKTCKRNRNVLMIRLRREIFTL